MADENTKGGKTGEGDQVVATALLTKGGAAEEGEGEGETA